MSNSEMYGHHAEYFQQMLTRLNQELEGSSAVGRLRRMLFGGEFVFDRPVERTVGRVIRRAVMARYGAISRNCHVRR